MSVTSVNSSRSAEERATVSMQEHEEVLEKLRRAEEEKINIIKDHGNLIKEFNRRMHVHLEEIRLLKEVNHKVQADMQELRDLCCYLDDDRHKCRKLAREWQRFGRYTATAMRNEVSEYQDKIHVLEIRQSELSSDNNELKELCLYLDQQRENLTQSRICSKCFQSTGSEATSSSIGRGFRDILKEKGVGYSEKLEARLSTIGTERRNSLPKPQESYMNGRGQKKRVSFTFPEEIDTDTDSADSFSRSTFPKTIGFRDNAHPGILRNGLKPLPKRGALAFPENTKMTPEAVQQAMKVLEIHEKLDHQSQAHPEKDEEKLGENEVAVLKEMCNVVWRKLSNGNSEPTKLNGHAEEDEDEVLEDLL